MVNFYMAYDIINTLVVLIAFWFYGKLMPLKPRKKAVIYITYVVVYCLCMGTGIMRRTELFDSSLGAATMSCAYFIIQFISILFLYEGKISNKFFVFCINKICEAAGIAATDYVVSLFPPEYGFNLGKTITDLTMLSFYVFTTVVVFFLEVLVVFIAKNGKNGRKKTFLEYVFFVLVPLSQMVLYMQALVLTGESENYYKRMGNVWLLVGMLASVFGDFALFFTISKLKKMNELEKKMASMEAQMDKSVNDLEEIESISKRQNMIFHDLKNQVLAFGMMIDTNDMTRAKSQLEEISGLVKMFEDKSLCENRVVNTMLNYKAHIAHTKQINVDMDIKISDELNIVDADLCSVFSNIFDNAIEAVGAIPSEEDRYIRLKCKQTHGYLLILQENKLPPKAAVPQKDDGAVHGLGLSILEFIADKYEGEFEYEMKDESFYLKMSIPC